MRDLESKRRPFALNGGGAEIGAHPSRGRDPGVLASQIWAALYVGEAGFEPATSSV